MIAVTHVACSKYNINKYPIFVVASLLEMAHSHDKYVDNGSSSNYTITWPQGEKHCHIRVYTHSYKLLMVISEIYYNIWYNLLH